MRRSSLVALALMVVASVSCGAHHQGSSSAAPVGADVVIKQKADGTTVQARPGDTLHFVLRSGVKWRLTSYPRGLFRVTAAPTTGRFQMRVRGAGAGTVKAMGTPECRKKTCPETPVAFSVTVQSSWIP